MIRGTNRPPFTADIEDVSEQNFLNRARYVSTQCACNPGCGTTPACGRSGDLSEVFAAQNRILDAITTSERKRGNEVDIPFALPADSIEITLDLPMPPSINRLWKHGRGRVYKSSEYVKWMERTDMTVMATKRPGRLPKITGPFELRILLNEEMSKADGDNVAMKAVCDWLQSRDIIRNDKDNRRWSGEWVEAERAPKGCRVTLRSLHG